MTPERILVLIIAISATLANCAPVLQHIPPRPGYIPVYIRPGDAKLEDINPDLAEAFNSYDRLHDRSGHGRLITKTKESINEVQKIEDGRIPVTIQTAYESKYIQKIPKAP